MKNKNKILVYGKKPIMQLVKKQKLNSVLLQDNLKGSEIFYYLVNNKVKVDICNKKYLNKLTNFKKHQGVVSYLKNFCYEELKKFLEDNKTKKKLSVVLLDNTEDPYNFGSIIRTCVGMNVDTIIISKNNQVKITSAVIKASVGTVFDIEIILVPNIIQTIKFLKKENFWIYGSCLNPHSKPIQKINFADRKGIIFGNEKKGIRELVLKNCDELFKLNISDKVNSYNLSAAACAILYWIVNK